ncbi:FG-GAP repeat domain-containing protein, partial [Streptomyces zhihengii]
MTDLEFLGHTVPPVVDLDQNRGQVPMTWRLSHLDVKFTVLLRHVASGQAYKMSWHPGVAPGPDPQVTGLTWDGRLFGANGSTAAPNGEYIWEVTAVPTTGSGDPVTAAGTFTVTRTPGPHDYTDNSTPDLLARDSAGRLWREDTSSDTLDNNHLNATGRRLVGGGWQIFNSIEAAGNLVGGLAGDLVARDTAGVLWLYQGRG